MPGSLVLLLGQKFDTCLLQPKWSQWLKEDDLPRTSLQCTLQGCVSEIQLAVEL